MFNKLVICPDFDDQSLLSKKPNLIKDNRNYSGVYVRLFCLPLLMLLTGCLADPIKLSGTAIPKLLTIMVAPVEPPPLEVIPDLLESRLPVYGHYHNMVLPIYLEQKIYRNPGGILIAGQVGNDDIVPEATFPVTKEATGRLEYLQPIQSQPGNWLPTLALAREAMARLNAGSITAVPSSFLVRLPLAERSADLVKWRNAIERWYDRDTSEVDYRQLNNESVDAVLEVGIGQYRIFEGQTSLQVLIKLVDSGTGRVIARTSQQKLLYEASAQALLNQEGAMFKSLILKSGARLLDRGFNDIGLTPKRLSSESEKS